MVDEERKGECDGESRRIGHESYNSVYNRVKTGVVPFFGQLKGRVSCSLSPHKNMKDISTQITAKIATCPSVKPWNAMEV